MPAASWQVKEGAGSGCSSQTAGDSHQQLSSWLLQQIWRQEREEETEMIRESLNGWVQMRGVLSLLYMSVIMVVKMINITTACPACLAYPRYIIFVKASSGHRHAISCYLSA